MILKYSKIAQVILVSLLILQLVQTAKPHPLKQLQKKTFTDDSELVKLAQEQKFVIPLNGKTISHSIQYVPKNSGQCSFIQPSISLKSIAQSQSVFNAQDEIAAILPLKTRQIVLVADPYYNVASYSIDRHFLMKPKLPKTKIMKSNGKNVLQLANPVLVSTANEQYIYYLTTQRSSVFHYSNVASDIKQFQLEGQPSVIRKAIEHNGFVILCGGVSGIFVYRIDQNTKYLKLVKIISPKKNSDSPVDFELNENTELLYVLNEQKTINVYLFKSIEENSKKEVLTEFDEINLQNITLNHISNLDPNEMIGHLSIEISRKKSEQTIMVLFTHNTKTVIAQINYRSIEKQYSFVRYYKYSVQINEIHVIEQVMIVIGNGILGMFNYQINPHLIAQQFNGFMTLSPLSNVVITTPPFFVGTVKNQIEFAQILLNNQAGINCHLSASSELKQIKFRANLTVCEGDQQPSIDKYCQYQKVFLIKQLQITASGPIAASLWIATIIFTLLVIVGLCCLFAIQKKKDKQIRKLQLYFQERRRAVPASSERPRNQS